MYSDACAAPNCDRLVGRNGGHGLCPWHNQRRLKGLPLAAPHRHELCEGPCVVSGCARPVTSRGRCAFHYNRKRAGVHDSHPFKKRRPEFRKFEQTHADGYVWQVAFDGSKTLQHRLIMEKKLGRKLLPHETVHHKNGQRADNRLSNLELWSSSHPPGQRVSDKLKWCKEFLKQYGTLINIINGEGRL